MKHEDQNENKSTALEEDRQMRRVLQLTRKDSLRRMEMKELLARVPDDWEPGEANVDEFLNSIRGGNGSS